MSPSEIVQRTLQMPDREMMKEITRLDVVNRASNIIHQMTDYQNSLLLQVYTHEGRQIMDGLLAAYQPDIGNLSMIALLRSTFMARYELENWNSCRDRAYQYCLKRDGEVVTARRFRGLM